MTPERWETIGNLYERALHCPPGQRAALLDRACAGDPELRREVESMIAAYEADPDFLEEPALPTIATSELLGEAGWDEDTHVGPYRLVRALGQGGMGEVFLAVRDLGSTRQTVALKLLRTGLTHEDVLHRFTAEQQILAQLTHPHIARLVDAGQAEDGRPFLVMEYVDGAPITAYCDQHRLTIDQRLRLFVQVCEAVQFAHQHLVIHRDLKPSNILVTAPPSGGPAGGQVKLLDFGIAKMLDPLATNAPLLQTRTGQRLLTPAYASPEQVDGASIATTSDVYSLGVLLYELLVGQRPYTLDGKTESEIARIIVEETPTRPSAAVTQPAPAPAAIGKARKSSPERLRRHLRGDLDTIVMKALRKEPGRRYQSAADLADDLERHLSGLPVRARPDTLGYRTRKFVRRHRWTVAAASVAVVLLLVFSTVTTMQSARIQAQAQSLILERDRAEQELAKSEAVTSFLMDLFEANRPSEARGDTITARELLTRGVERVEALEEQPEVQTRMMDLIGRIYRNLGEYDQASPLIERALTERRRHFGEEHEDVASSLYQLANLRADQGQFEEAMQRSREALALRRALPGDHQAAIASSLRQLATHHKYLGNYDEAERRFRELLALERTLYAPTDLRIAQTLNNFGRLLDAKYEYETAHAHFQEALAILRQHYEDDHPEVIYTRSNIGMALIRTEQYDEAERELREVVRLRRKVLGPTHPGLATSLNTLAHAVGIQGNTDEAVALFQEALTIYREAQGTNHPNVASTLYNMAFMQHKAERWEAAEVNYRTALAMRRKLLGDDHPRTARVQMFLARALHRQNDYAAAEPRYLEALDIFARKEGADSRSAVTIRGWLAELYEAMDRPESAARYRRE